MANESPVALIYSSDGTELTVKNGVAIPAGTPTIVMGGTDGGTARYMAVDSSGRSIVAGAGTAGTPVGGVLTIQGVTSGTAVTISGTVTANIGTTNGLALDATLTGGTAKSIVRGGAKGSTSAADVTSANVDANTQALHVVLASTGNIQGTGTAGSPAGGVLTIQGVASGQAVIISGTVTSNIGTTNGLALDATLTGGTAKSIVRGGAKGTTTAADVTSTAVDANTQALHVALTNTSVAVSGTVTANIGTTNGLALDATLTGGTQQTKITDGTNVAAVKAASTAAVATDKALVVAVSPNNTVGISGTVTANIGTTNGLALDATLTGGTVKAIARGGAKGSTTAADVTSTSVDANTQALDVSVKGTATVSGTVTANIGTTNGLALDATLTGGTQTTRITDGTNTATVKAASTAAVATDKALVVAISPNNPISTSSAKSTTGTSSNVVSAATNTTLLASNSLRLGATIFNDSSSILYVKLGATASATSYTVKLYPYGYYEVPYSYTGIIDGIWVSANGAARVSELT